MLLFCLNNFLLCCAGFVYGGIGGLMLEGLTDPIDPKDSWGKKLIRTLWIMFFALTWPAVLALVIVIGGLTSGGRFIKYVIDNIKEKNRENGK